MPFPSSVDTITDNATFGHASQVLGPQRITVGPAWFNVLSDVTGPADPTGATDSTAAIQAAEDAATAAGGTVYFPPGIYAASGIVKKSNANWLSAGIGATYISLKNGAPTGTPLVISQGFSGLTGGGTTGGILAFDVSNVTFDGNKANNASHAVPLIQLYGYGYRLHHFNIRNANNVSLRSEWASDASGPVTWPGFEAHIHNFSILNGGASVPGLQFAGPHDSIIADGQIENCGRGVHLVSASGGATQFRNVHCWGATQDWSWYLEDSAFLFGCEGEDGSAGAVWIRTTGQVQIAGGRYFLTPIGIRLGVTAGAAAARVRTAGVCISSCSTTAFDLQNDGGNNFLDYYSEGGNGAKVTGTMAGTTYVTDPVGVSGYEIMGLGGNGANLSLLGDGVTTPAKTIRVHSGVLEVRDNAYANAIMTLNDVGTMGLRGGIQPGTPAGGAQGNTLYMGSGVPSNANGVNGDYYLRTDTPGTANQRMYVKSVGAWVALTL